MLSGRIYTVEFDNVTVSAAQDWFYLAPADDKPIELLAVYGGQSSDVGDAAEEILRWRVIRGHATVGSGGTAPTPRPVKRGDGAAGFTARVNDTTIASAGTPINVHSDVDNIRTGIKMPWPESMEPDCSQADTSLVVRLLSAPTDALTMSMTAYVREFG